MDFHRDNCQDRVNHEIADGGDEGSPPKFDAAVGTSDDAAVGTSVDAVVGTSVDGDVVGSVGLASSREHYQVITIS